MKRLLTGRVWPWRRLLFLLAACALLVPTSGAQAQGVTTGQIQGVVNDAQGLAIPGASITAVHEPSGTKYESVTREDGRFSIPGVRVGGPYTVTAELAGFQPQTLKDIQVALGTSADLVMKLGNVAAEESVTVTATSDPVFTSNRTGAATAVQREDLASLPTVSGRITDITRLTPQFGPSGSFAGQDNRANNVTVDGSYFNNSFGLGVTTGGIGDRTGVAPISLEAIEQVQVNVAPYDVRQGNFTGAGVNTVTRSGTNRFTASYYHRMRNESFVGTEAKGNPYNPGTFDYTVNGVWAGGPIVKNKIFAFGAYEKQEDVRPLHTFQCNPGGAPVTGSMTRVLCSDMSALQTFMQNSFKYDTGPFQDIPKNTPAKPWMVKGDYNLNGSNKITFRYNQLSSSSDINQSGSSSLGTSRSNPSTSHITFANSNYEILENLKSGIGEWNTVIGSKFTNNLLIGYTKQDESRGPKGQTPLFPFIVIGAGDGSAYTSLGNEPFTPYNLLYYHTFQAQDSVTMYMKNHSLTFGGNIEKFHSDNSFYFGIQSAYSYNTLADFYADANGYIANPNRTTAAAASRFQVKYLLQPGQTTPPLQPLDVLYSGAYVQDQWRPNDNLSITAGLRVDIPSFGDTAFQNPVADTLVFRDQDGSPVSYSTGSLPDTTAYWSPRMGFNWDVTKDQKTQVRGGTGLFSGKPPYVWLSNQIGNTGVLYGFLDSGTNVTSYPFNPNPDKYKPAATGGTAASYELDVTDPGYKFPQTWRSNIGVDRKLWGGVVGALDYIYTKDVNAPVYINANLPAAQTAFTGVDTRPRWAAVNGVPACITSLGNENGPCVTRINNLPGKNITAAYVIKNQNDNHSWNLSGSLSKSNFKGFSFKGGFNIGESWSMVEPSSTAGSSWGSANPIVFSANTPPLAYSTNSPGKRVFLQGTYSFRYKGWGATTVSFFYDGRTISNTSWVFSGDANGDTVNGNDLIYIPKDASQMNFVQFTASGRTFTVAEQQAAFESVINSDSYLSKHRGEYAKRNATFLPMVNRIDFSIAQDLFVKTGSIRHGAQIRLDVQNFGNMLNHDWGVGTRLINNQILTNPAADANGALSYRMAVLNGALISNARQNSAGLSDVYQMMLSFRYMFN